MAGTSGRSLSRSTLRSLIRSWQSMAARQARARWSGTSRGAFQNAMMQSPINRDFSSRVRGRKEREKHKARAIPERGRAREPHPPPPSRAFPGRAKSPRPGPRTAEQARAPLLRPGQPRARSPKRQTSAAEEARTQRANCRKRRVAPRTRDAGDASKGGKRAGQPREIAGAKNDAIEMKCVSVDVVRPGVQAGKRRRDGRNSPRSTSR